MKLVAIGDSITEGYPFSPLQSWVEHLAKALKCEILNQGINGDFTRGMFKRFERDVLSCAPTHIMILGGANDAYEQIPLEQVSSNFREMVSLCTQQGVSPILGLPTPSLLAAEESVLIEYRNWLREYAAQNCLTVIDFYSPFRLRIRAGQAAALYVDEVHPSLQGYALMGEIAAQSWHNNFNFCGEANKNI
ncbi:GDSL-type esterase/lipase family protein [Desulfosporosinus sp. PR]|uniref:GDSL-type esterase/lipase family protein n=1 Tax=Candidatus Desulfosporosinus nitrosoreducens TaxID=3401928 RepID=UPI0027F363BC|nr:GDSL-type esterase/lipase family protein [Desulfosporosinus sp. PR]MDQ7094853.1 GDSL-type esterase/lipase family protein [Desulfosporosinus sp. PR]